jgi:hypothetical protein
VAPSIQQKLALFHELETAVKLVMAGLNDLQRIDGANDFYHVPMLTLASGCERYLKVVLCLRHLEVAGEFPTMRQLVDGRRGHDLNQLLDPMPFGNSAL